MDFDKVMHLHYLEHMKKLKKVAESTLTDRYQTTIPSFVRDELGLSKRDKLAFFKSEEGHLLLKRAEPEAEEFSAETLAWLDFLRQQQDRDPQSLTPITQELWDRISTLTAGIEVDLDKPLSEQ